MSLLTIDENRCKKDGLCAIHCPMGIIAWEKGQIPTLRPGVVKACIECGHCVAICPCDAISHQAMGPGECPRIKKELQINAEQATQFLRGRRSTRHFKSETVAPEVLEEIITLAAHAPSGHNCQPTLWQVVSGDEKVGDFAEMVIDWMRQTRDSQPELAEQLKLGPVVKAWDQGRDLIACNAPHLILVNGDGNNPMASIACTIAAAYLDLAAPAFGVGTCWLGYFRRALMNHPPLKEALGIKGSTRNFAVLAAGRPKRSYRRMPKRHHPVINWI